MIQKGKVVPLRFCVETRDAEACVLGFRGLSGRAAEECDVRGLNISKLRVRNGEITGAMKKKLWEKREEGKRQKWNEEEGGSL